LQINPIRRAEIQSEVAALAIAANAANAEQIYRLRAVTALGRLKTPAAVAALKEASSERSGYSDMVRRAALDGFAGRRIDGFRV
jgi:HEAT repeat protein